MWPKCRLPLKHVPTCTRSMRNSPHPNPHNSFPRKGQLLWTMQLFWTRRCVPAMAHPFGHCGTAILPAICLRQKPISPSATCLPSGHTKMPLRSIGCFVVLRCTVQRSGIVRHAAGKPMVREPLHAPLPAVARPSSGTQRGNLWCGNHCTRHCRLSRDLHPACTQQDHPIPTQATRNR